MLYPVVIFMHVYMATCYWRILSSDEKLDESLHGTEATVEQGEQVSKVDTYYEANK
jgi:hypothetical protein